MTLSDSKQSNNLYNTASRRYHTVPREDESKRPSIIHMSAFIKTGHCKYIYVLPWWCSAIEPHPTSRFATSKSQPELPTVHFGMLSLMSHTRLLVSRFYAMDTISKNVHLFCRYQMLICWRRKHGLLICFNFGKRRQVESWPNVKERRKSDLERETNIRDAIMTRPLM